MPYAAILTDGAVKAIVAVMTYARKLLISKIILTACVLFYGLVPALVDFGASHIGSNAWTSHARFHLSWTLISNVIALPVLLVVLWSKLHGTGRSVRLVGFLGLAYTLGFFAAFALQAKLETALYDVGQQYLIMGIDGNVVVNAVMTLLIIVAIVLSIKPRTD